MKYTIRVTYNQEHWGQITRAISEVTFIIEKDTDTQAKNAILNYCKDNRMQNPKMVIVSRNTIILE